MDQTGVYEALAFTFLFLWSAPGLAGTGTPSLQPAHEGKAEASVTVLFDNNRFDDCLKAKWGFSCLVKGWEKTILFDTGGDGAALLYNMSRLELEPAAIDAVFLSHIHADHTGGIGRFLEEKSDVEVYLPKSFPIAFKETLKSRGAHVIELSGTREILTGVYTTGELGGTLTEQSLILRTPKGIVVITGCAHPGIVNIVRRAKEITGEEKVYLVMGGFHLGGESASQIESILREFRCLSVQKVAPCHCTSDQARSIFRQEYGDNCIECGVGKRISLP